MVSTSTSTPYSVKNTHFSIPNPQKTPAAVKAAPNFLLKSLALLLIGLVAFVGGVMGQTTTIMSQGFENAGSLPTGWVVLQNGTGNLWGIGPTTGTSHAGSYCMEYNYNSTKAANTYFISSGVALTAGVTYTITYWENTGSLTEKLGLNVGTAQTVAGCNTVVKAATSYTNTTYAQISTTYTPASSAT